MVLVSWKSLSKHQGPAGCVLISRRSLISPELSKPIRRKCRVPCRRLQIAMPEIVRKRSRVIRYRGQCASVATIQDSVFASCSNAVDSHQQFSLPHALP